MTDPDPSRDPLDTTEPSSAPRLSRALQVGVFVASLIVSWLAVGMLQWVRSRQVAELEARVEREKHRAQELASVKPRFQLYQRFMADLTRRVDTIERLLRSRVCPGELIRALRKADTMSGGISLLTVAGEGRRLVLGGQSRSLDSMASFLTYLVNSGNFADVHLRQFHQDKDQTPPSYKFSLDCVFLPPARPDR